MDLSLLPYAICLGILVLVVAVIIVRGIQSQALAPYQFKMNEQTWEVQSNGGVFVVRRSDIPKGVIPEELIKDLPEYIAVFKCIKIEKDDSSKPSDSKQEKKLSSKEKSTCVIPVQNAISNVWNGEPPSPVIQELWYYQMAV
jgi:hypothetical protein